MVRAWTIARQRALNEALAEDEATPLAILAWLLLWLLRLALAPRSTLTGFRRWVVDECPAAPGRQASQTPQEPILPPTARAAIPARPAASCDGAVMRAGTKTAAFLNLVAERHGPLVAFPLRDVSRVSFELAPEVGLHPGAARAALRRRVQSLQNGSAP